MREPAAPEKIRLVIWDLDDTFWSGTLTEGGITWRHEHAAIVHELARRGIVSSICSKNDHAAVEPILQREAIWDSFIFPSITWEPKGPRLAALVESVQLRPSTILFIDDNPMNRAEARHFVPGIQVADETIIPHLLNDPRLQGKDDRALTRLAQYKLLQRRQSEQQAAGADTSAFLRASNISVSIEHDLDPHIDRAIELINRTNQLNYTKRRLPENGEAARRALRDLLSGFNVQAGILRVTDKYGDYGHCGLYIVQTRAADRRLIQFCFSCRILNMGVETWLYNHLGRPNLSVQGEVLSDVLNDKRDIDWIHLAHPSATAGAQSNAACTLHQVYARGGCDLNAVTHYFGNVARHVVRDFHVVRDGANMRRDHSVFARYALRGVEPAARQEALKLGWIEADFRPAFPPPPSGLSVWILSFWADANYALYRHRATGLEVPLCLPDTQTNNRNMLGTDPETLDDNEARRRLRHVQQNYDFAGMIAEQACKENIRLVLGQAPPGTKIFILLANEDTQGGRAAVSSNRRRLNAWTREAVQNHANVELITISDFFREGDAPVSFNHFDRMVYFRIFQHIMSRLPAQQETEAA
jgi:FkbH-like protein